MLRMAKLLSDWSPQTKFVEIDVRDDALARRLGEAGFSQYLGVSRNASRVAALTSAAGRDQFVHSSERRWVLRNNADVLILSGASPLYLWKHRDVRHARHVAWRLGFHPVLLAALLGWLVRFIVGQYGKPARLAFRNARGRRQMLLVSRVMRPKRCYHDALHFIPHELRLNGLFGQFHEQSVQYTVLRWFESLPEVEPDGDVDLLIADDDLPRVLELLNSAPGVQPCDVYTPSGLAESRYLKASYFPPAFARQLLSRAVRHRNFCQVPGKLDYFHSLAYHAVYHKGPNSGLPGSEEYSTSGRRSSHDFSAILSEMAQQLGIDVEVSLCGLHEYLQRQQIGPSPDFIVRMAASAPQNRWLAHLAEQAEGDVRVDPGLVVWVIRQSAVDVGVDSKIAAMIESHGFSRLVKKCLSPAEIALGASCTRGGNWGPGPKDHLGGPPVIMMATFDPHPLRPTRAQRKRFPRVTNARTLVKEEIRRKINELIAPAHPINGVHSSDYGAEAHHFLSVFAPELIDEVNRKIAAFRERDLQRRRAA
jgi:hypothetical protein